MFICLSFLYLIVLENAHRKTSLHFNIDIWIYFYNPFMLIFSLFMFCRITYRIYSIYRKKQKNTQSVFYSVYLQKRQTRTITSLRQYFILCWVCNSIFPFHHISIVIYDIHSVLRTFIAFSSIIVFFHVQNKTQSTPFVIILCFMQSCLLIHLCIQDTLK